MMVSAVMVPSGGSGRTIPVASNGSAVLADLSHRCPLSALVLTQLSQLVPSLSYMDNADGLMMTVLIQFYQQRPFFQIRSRLQVPSRHVFLRGT